MQLSHPTPPHANTPCSCSHLFVLLLLVPALRLNLALGLELDAQHRLSPVRRVGQRLAISRRRAAWSAECLLRWRR